MHSKTSQKQRMQIHRIGMMNGWGFALSPPLYMFILHSMFLNLSHSYPNAIRGLQFALQKCVSNSLPTALLRVQVYLQFWHISQYASLLIFFIMFPHFRLVLVFLIPYQ